MTPYKKTCKFRLVHPKVDRQVTNVNKYFSIEKNRVRVVDKSNPILSERKTFVHFAPISTGFKLVVYNSMYLHFLVFYLALRFRPTFFPVNNPCL